MQGPRWRRFSSRLYKIDAARQNLENLLRCDTASQELNENVDGFYRTTPWYNKGKRCPSANFRTVEGLYTVAAHSISEAHSGSNQWLDLWVARGGGKFSSQDGDMAEGTKCVAGTCRLQEPVYLMYRWYLQSLNNWVNAVLLTITPQWGLIRLKGKYTLKIKFSPVIAFWVLSRMVLVRGSCDAPFLLFSQSNPRTSTETGWLHPTRWGFVCKISLKVLCRSYKSTDDRNWPICCSLLDAESTDFGPKRLRCSVPPLFPIEHGWRSGHVLLGAQIIWSPRQQATTFTPRFNSSSTRVTGLNPPWKRSNRLVSCTLRNGDQVTDVRRSTWPLVQACSIGNKGGTLHRSLFGPKPVDSGSKRLQHMGQSRSSVLL